MTWGKQVARFEILKDADCELCGMERWAFRCKVCGQTVCIDCDCKCDAEGGA